MRHRRPSFRNLKSVARLISLLLIGAVCGVRPCAADEIGDFYAGKTITILVGYEAGGGYDLYARLAAQFLGRYLPGQPAVIVQNMPGAGGLKAAHFLLDVAPKDGTTLGIPSQTIVFDTCSATARASTPAAFSGWAAWP
jgi:tripartite-type tricarboxylate transporter receptor subunit TctC